MSNCLKKGDRVEWKNKGEVFYGVVSRGGAARVTVIQDGGKVNWKGSVHLFHPSNKPLTEEMKSTMNNRLKKGDRVEWDDKGEMFYGVVTNGGTKVTVMQDGGQFKLKGGAGGFNLSNHPLAVDKPSSMDKWSVKSFKEFMHGHGDSATFHAKICLNGKVVGTAENDGWGGCNLYHFDKGVYGKFSDDVKSWVAQFGYSDMLEAEDTWLFWFVNEKPYGVTAEDKIAEDKKSMESFMNDNA